MPDEVTIGIVTAIPIELAAVRMILDDVFDQRRLQDPNNYCIGYIPVADSDRRHRVVAGQQTRDGTRNAAATVIDMMRSFPSLRAVVMCGIAAGAPRSRVSRGDIVSATGGVVDYGHLRAVAGARRLRRPAPDVSAALLRADHRLAEGAIHGRRPWEITLAELQDDNAAFRRPEPAGPPTVHRGAVGSGDVLLRDAALRDDLAGQHDVLAFEMEGSGVSTSAALHGKEWFMVRGISDLGDERKDDRWLGYAAAAAAAYLRNLLRMTDPWPTAGGGGPGAAGNGSAVGRMVEAMLNVRRIRDENERQRLLDELPAYIRAGIPYSPTARTHVISIIRTCESFPEGQGALLEALGLFLGPESPEFGTVAGVLRDGWRGA